MHIFDSWCSTHHCFSLGMALEFSGKQVNFYKEAIRNKRLTSVLPS